MNPLQQTKTIAYAIHGTSLSENITQHNNQIHLPHNITITPHPTPTTTHQNTTTTHHTLTDAIKTAIQHYTTQKLNQYLNQ